MAHWPAGAIAAMIFGRVEYTGMANNPPTTPPPTGPVKDFIFVPNADGTGYDTAINGVAITHVGYRPDGGVSVVLGSNAISYEAGSEGAKIFNAYLPPPPAKKDEPPAEATHTHAVASQHGPAQVPDTKHKP